MVQYLDMNFDWDKNKAKSNKSKHDITFLEAITVFGDDRALYLSDEIHSEYEKRFIVIGMSKDSNLLMVCHCYRENDTVIRIISARKADKTESKLYGGA